MHTDRDRRCGGRNVLCRAMVKRGILTRGAIVLGLVGVSPDGAAQQPTAPAAALVFDGVTVVDVAQGKLLPAQRVAIVGNRIRAIGSEQAVAVPTGARVVDARGKYLIPGLWDMHVHQISRYESETARDRIIDRWQKSRLAAGVTGIRDAGASSLNALLRRRQEILAGRQVGPPRQLLSGQYLGGPRSSCARVHMRTLGTCVVDPADARHLVDSLKAAGVDMIKPREVSRELYFAIAAEARRLGIPFGGHASEVTPTEASDSGARLIDHTHFNVPDPRGGNLPLIQAHPCLMRTPAATVAQCAPLAARFRANHTWWVPTMAVHVFLRLFDRDVYVAPRYGAAVRTFYQRRGYDDQAIERAIQARFPLGVAGAPPTAHKDGPGLLSIAQEVGLPILAGTDTDALAVSEGFDLHLELALFVAEGLTPVEALRTATLNPAQMLGGTDSLGTVAPGKLADLVLLDADPLADIANTLAIRAVVANGRYFDRAALDELLAEARAEEAVRPARATVSGANDRP